MIDLTFRFQVLLQKISDELSLRDIALLMRRSMRMRMRLVDNPKENENSSGNPSENLS